MTPSVGSEHRDLLDALIYGDVFDCAITLDELWRYARVAIDRDELARRLRDDPVLRRVVVERDGLYCLAGRTTLLDLRPGRIARARRLQRRGRRIARVLRQVPFVRGILLTGSASADDATATADIDLLVIVAPGRIATTFLLLGSLSRLLGRQSFCPNWYMSEDSLGSRPRSLYIGREFAQAHSLAGNADALRDANRWIQELFPNAVAPPPLDPSLTTSPSLQRWLEAPLRGKLGGLLERWARHVATVRLRAHYALFGEEVPADVAARVEAGVALGFHGFHYEESTLNAHAIRRARLLDDIERALTAAAAGATSRRCAHSHFANGGPPES